MAAVAALLAVVGSVLVVAGPAQAAESEVGPGPATLASPALVPISSWTASGTSAASPLPGNLAALGSAALQAPGQTITTADGQAVRATPDTAVGACLGANTAVGYTTECRTLTSTLTFAHPVVNPLFAIATGVRVHSANGVQCMALWQDTTFSAVDGTSPAAGQITPYGALADNTSFADNRLSYSPASQLPCQGVPSGYSYLTVGGLVSSVSFTYTEIATITRNDPGTTMPAMEAPANGVYLNVYLPAAELSVTKTGPSTVTVGGAVTWQLTAENAAGSSPSHGFVVHDAVPAGVTNAQVVSSPPGASCSVSGNDVLCSAAPAGWTVTQNSRVPSVADLSGGDASSTIPGVLNPGEAFGPIVIEGTAPATAGATLTNAATIAGADVDTDLTNNSSSVTTDVIGAPSLSLAKTATSGGAPVTTLTPGETIDYSFLVTNTGPVALSGVGIVEQEFTGSGAMTTPVCPAGDLAPGAQMSCTASYVVTAADVASGTIDNTAIARGTAAGATTPTDSAPSSVQVPVAVGPLIGLTKTGALAAGGTGAVGDTVDYTFVAVNAGSVPLTGVTIADPLPGLSALTYTWPGAPGTLAAGQSVTATATYVLTQADVDAGSLVNTATATGTGPGGTPVTAKDTASVTLEPAPALTLKKTGALATGSTGAVGDTIDYAFAAKNTGNVTLTGVTIADPLPGLSALTYTWPGAAGTLAPGQSVTATATYVLTQADVDAGSLVNTATATGTGPGGTPVTAKDTATVTLEPAPALTLKKTGALATGSTGAVGDTIDYTFAAKNTGNVTLTGVTIADPLPGLSALTFTWPGAAGTLAPGQSVTATASYVVTQADVDAGSLVNTATATGAGPGGTPVTAEDTATVTLEPAPALTLKKTGALATGSTGAVGDTIDYTFAANNTGNVTLTGVTIADPLPGLSALTYTWPGAPGTLAPGQSVTATATYSVTGSDLTAGSVANTASASGTDPSGGTVDATSDRVVVRLGVLAATGASLSPVLTVAAPLLALAMVILGLVLWLGAIIRRRTTFTV